jgi:hypothetical protein
MNTEEMKRVNKMQISLQKNSINSRKWQTCLNCDYWNGDVKNANGPAGCLVFKAMPPPHVIVNGCEEHSTDDIPF